MITQYKQQSEAWEIEKQTLNDRILTLETELQQMLPRKRKEMEGEQGEGESEVDKENNIIGVEKVLKMNGGVDTSEESSMKRAKVQGLEGPVQGLGPGSPLVLKHSDTLDDNIESTST